jgi:lysophospholipase L1-like esterase
LNSDKGCDGNEPDARAERDAACGEEESQTSSAKVAGSMAPQTHCLRVTEQSKIDGRARPELFVKDRLHFSPEGYKMLAERVRPFLAQ